MPRDTPPIALPALGLSDANKGALRYGGYPRLPETVDWPVYRDGAPFHFLAEIDLAALPREMEQAGHHYDMPNFPETGFIYIFLRLDGDMIYDAQPIVLFAPDASAETPHRTPPEPLPVLDPDDAYAFHPDAVAADGVSLKTGYMAASAFLSARAENTLWRNMDRGVVSEDESYRRDKAFADQLNALGIEHKMPPPSPPAAREALFDQIAEYFQGFFKRGVFQWEWRYIFEVAKTAYASCFDFPIEELRYELDNGNDHRRFHKLIAKFEAKKDAVLRSEFEDRLGWWESISCDHIPSLDMRLDVQLRRWMGYARVTRHRGMTQEDKEAFVALLHLVSSYEGDRRPADLKVMAMFPEHDARRSYLESIVSDGFERAATALRHLHPERSPEPTNDFGDADTAARHVQVFGAGYLLQHAAIEHEDKVMLFQLSDACGVEFVDGILQM